MNKKLLNAKPINMKKSLKVILIGFFAGIISGFFGAGGGMLLIPFLIHALKMDDVKSRASTVFCVLFMVITSSIFYFQSDYIDFNIAFKCAIGGIIGGYIGSKILLKVNKKYLKIVSILFVLYSGVRML